MAYTIDVIRHPRSGAPRWKPKRDGERRLLCATDQEADEAMAWLVEQGELCVRAVRDGEAVRMATPGPDGSVRYYALENRPA